MACTFNVEIGKKQIDKQSGRIKESFWVSDTMENYHAPKSKVQVHPMWKTRKRQSVKPSWKKKILYKVSNTVENYLVQQPMCITLPLAVWTTSTSTSTLAIENGN